MFAIYVTAASDASGSLAKLLDATLRVESAAVGGLRSFGGTDLDGEDAP
jgi:hypothetical protein